VLVRLVLVVFFGSTCKFGLSCNTNGVCVAPFSVSAGGACSTISDCNSGLVCYQGSCTTPSYHFLPPGGGAIWGPDCDPNSGAPGCICNYNAKIYMYLKEASITLPASLTNMLTDFTNCMTTNGCSGSITLGYGSCLRKYCYAQYTNLIDNYQYPQPDLRPPHCGANGIIIMTLSMIVLMLL